MRGSGTASSVSQIRIAPEGYPQYVNRVSRVAVWNAIPFDIASQAGGVHQAQLFRPVLGHLLWLCSSGPFSCRYRLLELIDGIQWLIAHLCRASALGANRPNGLFFAGDLGQRIFQQPFSWKSLGVDIRGRSRTLHINYRTSHQIRMQADQLLGPELSDVDGNVEERRGTVSVFNGPAPAIRRFGSQEEELSAVAAWLTERSKEGVMPHEIGVFVRSEAELERARAAVAKAGLPFKVLDEHVDTSSGQVSISTMHLAKGLEFRAVSLMACDDEITPLQSRIETVADDSDLEEVYNTERHLLYVACTRARDHLLVTSVDPASEFLDDLRKR